MSLTRDQQRLLKIDNEILELRYLYERELVREMELDKHHLLISRGFKHRLDKMVKARALFATTMKTKHSQKTSYTIELRNRELAFGEAQSQVAQITQTIAVKLATVQDNEQLGIASDGILHELHMLNKDYKAAQIVFQAKKRALENWEANGALHAHMASKDKLPRNYDAERDTDAIYGQISDNEIVRTALAYDIRNTPNFHEKPVTNITIDMITQPEDMHLFEVDKDASEVVLKQQKQERLTPEQIEERTFAEMHSTKYPVVMID